MATVNSLPEWPTNCYAQKICVLACHPPLNSTTSVDSGTFARRSNTLKHEFIA